MTDFIKEMYENAASIRKNSYSVYSNYKVGACIRTEDNQLFSGTNVENASYSVTCCAETGAIMSMIGAGITKIAEVLVIGSGSKICTPCGACRQRIREFADEKISIHCCNQHGDMKSMTLGELLPEAYGPENLREC